MTAGAEWPPVAPRWFTKAAYHERSKSPILLTGLAIALESHAERAIVRNVLEYRPIKQWSDLPASAPRDLPESIALDFKADHARDAGEHAKDMAAFANVLGGTILVGAAEKADSYERKLLPVASAVAAARDYEDAARDLLAPAPMVDAVVIPFPGNGGLALVAVNVDPFAGQMVGARLPGLAAWRFPMRTAARHTSYLDPVHMMIHSDPKTRKVAILLGGIPVSERKPLQIQIMERYEMEIFSNTEEVRDGELLDVDPATNTVSVSALVHDRSEVVRFLVPLEDVQAVWRTPPGWSIRINGALVFRRDRQGHRATRYMSGRGPFNWD